MVSLVVLVLTLVFNTVLKSRCDSVISGDGRVQWHRQVSGVIAGCFFWRQLDFLRHETDKGFRSRQSPGAFTLSCFFNNNLETKVVRLELCSGLGLLFSSQSSVFQCLTSSGFDMGQSGVCAADDAAQTRNDLPWQPAQRPPQAGGGLWPSSCPRWCGCCRVARGCSRGPELWQNSSPTSVLTNMLNTGVCVCNKVWLKYL